MGIHEQCEARLEASETARGEAERQRDNVSKALRNAEKSIEYLLPLERRVTELSEAIDAFLSWVKEYPVVRGRDEKVLIESRSLRALIEARAALSQGVKPSASDWFASLPHVSKAEQKRRDKAQAALSQAEPPCHCPDGQEQSQHARTPNCPVPAEGVLFRAEEPK